MKKLVSILLTTFTFTACGGSAKQEAVSSAKEIRQENLWVSDAVWNTERYLPENNPCYGSMPLNGSEARFTTWSRQRAGYTNVCFEVWMPGVTDQENPEFWRLLDVKMHYRWVGGSEEWQVQPVNARDRVGNNRRYIWNMREKDAFGTFADAGDVPITVLDDYPDSRQYFGEATLEFYFTVNDHGLGNHDATPYRIRYEGYKFRY